MEAISIDELHKVEIRVGEIRSAERIEESEKLLKLKVDFGMEERQVLSGIAKFFADPSALVGKRCAFVTNLPARSMMGLESQAMLLAVGGDGGTPFALFETVGQPGSRAH